MPCIEFGNVRSILCLGAHPDDIEIGCGGTLSSLVSESNDVLVHWIVLSGSDSRRQEALASADCYLHAHDQHRVEVKGFRDSFFPAQIGEIKQYFSELASQVNPDLIFTHRREDAHQDHRLVAELTWNAFRQHTIFEYEIPKYEGDLGHPNVYLPLSKVACEEKIQTLEKSFPSQLDKPWFTGDTFWALLRLRGIETASATKFAAAFTCRKITLLPRRQS